MGPVGSSKSSACCTEIFDRACRQEAHNQTRSTRWAVVRNTFGELKSTTLKTWAQWFPGEVAPVKWDSPISSNINFWLPDKTRVKAEVLFFPLDRPEDVGKLRSLELTGAWINEASEISKAALDMLTQRVGRYPPKKYGGPTWSGVVMDTNPPDDDHWYYRMAEKEHPKGWKFFRQPGGLIEQEGRFLPNPEAENIENLPGGYEYYQRMLAGKSREWIKVFVLGNYGTISDGKPIYPEWNDEIHVKSVEANPELPLILGFDYGLTPACVICQVTPHGTLIVLDELFSKEMGIRQFSRDVVRPHLAVNYPRMRISGVGDPAGMARKDTDEKTCFMVLAEEGFACAPASTNSFAGRREAVAKYLTRLSDGKPAFQLDPRCDMLRRGFNGRYQFKRLQVVGEERFRDVADKNDASHLHDALQYACLYTQQLGDGSEWAKPLEYPQAGIV